VKAFEKTEMDHVNPTLFHLKSLSIFTLTLLYISSPHFLLFKTLSMYENLRIFLKIIPFNLFGMKSVSLIAILLLHLFVSSDSFQLDLFHCKYYLAITWLINRDNECVIYILVGSFICCIVICEVVDKASGSSIPDCSNACGPCKPCKLVVISSTCSASEACPLVYKCLCKGKYYHVPSLT